MIRTSLALLPALAVVALFCACSSKPSGSENNPASSEASVTPKPRVDFGQAELSPTTGSGTEATFRVTFKPASQKPLLIGLLINDRQNGGNACYPFRNLSANNSFLVPDSGSGQILLGKETSVTNHQCELLRDGTVSTDDASGVTATFHVRFSPAFRGIKQIWVVPEGATANAVDMQRLGDWTVQ